MLGHGAHQRGYRCPADRRDIEQGGPAVAQQGLVVRRPRLGALGGPALPVSHGLLPVGQGLLPVQGHMLRVERDAEAPLPGRHLPQRVDVGCAADHQARLVPQLGQAGGGGIGEPRARLRWILLLRRLPGGGEGVGQPPPVEVVHRQPVHVRGGPREQRHRQRGDDQQQLAAGESRLGAVACPPQREQEATEHDYGAGQPRQQHLPQMARQLPEQAWLRGRAVALGLAQRSPFGQAGLDVPGHGRHRGDQSGQRRGRPGRLPAEAEEMGDRAQRSGAVGQPRDQRRHREHRDGQPDGHGGGPAHPCRAVGPAVGSIRPQRPQQPRPAAAPGHRGQGQPPEPEQRERDHGHDRRRQPPARPGDRGRRRVRPGRHQYALPAQQPAPGVRQRIQRRERHNERHHRPEQQRQDADQHRRRVRRNVVGVVPEVQFLRAAGGVGVLLFPRWKIVRNERTRRGDIAASRHPQDPLDLR